MLERLLKMGIMYAPDNEEGTEETPVIEEAEETAETTEETIENPEATETTEATEEVNEEKPDPLAELKAEIEALKSQLDQAKETTKETTEELPDIPDFFDQAAREAAKYPGMVDENNFLTEKGEQYVRNRAAVLAAEHTQLGPRFEADVPRAQTLALTQAKETGFAEDEAERISGDYGKILKSYGPKLLSYPKEVLQMIDDRAYLEAVGRETLRQRAKTKEGGTEAGEKVEPAPGAGTSVKLDPDDLKFIESYKKEVNNGKPLTRAQLQKLQDGGLITSFRN